MFLVFEWDWLLVLLLCKINKCDGLSYDENVWLLLDFSCGVIGMDVVMIIIMLWNLYFVKI